MLESGGDVLAPVVGLLFLFSSCWLLVVCCLLMFVVSCWLFVGCCWLFVSFWQVKLGLFGSTEHDGKRKTCTCFFGLC